MSMIWLLERKMIWDIYNNIFINYIFLYLFLKCNICISPQVIRIIWYHKVNVIYWVPLMIPAMMYKSTLQPLVTILVVLNLFYYPVIRTSRRPAAYKVYFARVCVLFRGKRGAVCVGNGWHFRTSVLMNMCNITFEVPIGLVLSKNA